MYLFKNTLNIKAYMVHISLSFESATMSVETWWWQLHIKSKMLQDTDIDSL